MIKSKWDKRKLGHYRPIKDCKIPEQTFGEICHECNKCGRFNSIARRKRKVKKEYGIDWRFIGGNNKIFRGWKHWKNYKTETIRDEALKHLNKKLYYDMKIFQFRKSNPS